jgi:hypothetical protein
MPREPNQQQIAFALILVVAASACTEPFVPVSISEVVPSDTLVRVGTSYRLTARAFDATGRVEPVTEYEALDADVIRVDGDVVTGVRPSRSSTAMRTMAVMS